RPRHQPPGTAGRAPRPRPLETLPGGPELSPRRRNAGAIGPGAPAAQPGQRPCRRYPVAGSHRPGGPRGARLAPPAGHQERSVAEPLGVDGPAPPGPRRQPPLALLACAEPGAERPGRPPWGRDSGPLRVPREGAYLPRLSRRRKARAAPRPGP